MDLIFLDHHRAVCVKDLLRTFFICGKELNKLGGPQFKYDILEVTA